MKFLKLLYRGWIKIAHAIGRVNTVILLAVVYVIVFGVAKIISLFSRKDILESNLDQQAPSYWKRRQGLLVDKEAFLKPY